MANQYVCAYFKSDKSFSVVPKKRCVLRGAFEEGGEVEVTWRGPDNDKQAYIGKIVKIADKKEKKVLDRFQDYCIQTLHQREKDGCSEDAIVSDLCQVSLKNFSALTSQSEDGGNGSLGKRKRKTTTVMRESMDQENQHEVNKTRRKDDKGKENVDCNQPPSTQQATRKVNGSRQRQTAEQSTVTNMGQLMFTSKYGTKFPSNLTNLSATNPAVSPGADRVGSSRSDPVSSCSQDKALSPTPSAYQTVPQPPTHLATSLNHPLVPQQAIYPAPNPSNPLVLTTHQTPPSCANYQGSTQAVTGLTPSSAPQAGPYIYPPIPSTKPVATRCLAPQPTYPPPLLSTKPGAPPALTSQATNPIMASSTLISTAKPVASLNPAPGPEVTSSVLASNPQVSTETSISQTWAKCDQALVLSGLHEDVSYCQNQLDEDIQINISDGPTQLSSLSREIPPQSTIVTCNQESTLQNIISENETLKAENSSLKSELLTLKAQLEVGAPAPSTEVLSFLQSLIHHYTENVDQVQPVTKYTVRANLSPIQSSRKNTVRLLEGREVFVDRTALRGLIQKAHQKGPAFLLKKLIPLVFSTEELANSCGQGLVLKKGKGNQTSKLPLNPEKVAVCKEYITAFYLEREKEGQARNLKMPTEAQINETFTQQVTYSRVKLQRAGTFSSPSSSNQTPILVDEDH